MIFYEDIIYILIHFSCNALNLVIKGKNSIHVNASNAHLLMNVVHHLGELFFNVRAFGFNIQTEGDLGVGGGLECKLLFRRVQEGRLTF